MNLTPDSASDLEAGIQESCSGIIHFNISLLKSIIMPMMNLKNFNFTLITF